MTALKLFIGGFIFLALVSAGVAGLLTLAGVSFWPVMLGSMITSTVFLSINTWKFHKEGIL